MKIEKADFVDLVHSQKLVLYLDDGSIISHEIKDRPVFLLTKQLTTKLVGATVVALYLDKTSRDLRLKLDYCTKDEEDLTLLLIND